jgi:hypothetical protein
VEHRHLATPIMGPDTGPSYAEESVLPAPARGEPIFSKACAVSRPSQNVASSVGADVERQNQELTQQH